MFGYLYILAFAMDKHYSRITCLSSEDHGCAIKEHLRHYLGCIEISERDTFFEDSNSLWEVEIEHQIKLGMSRAAAKELVSGKREAWKSNCLSELRRIDFLRKTLKNDDFEKHLVAHVEESRETWRNSSVYQSHIQMVKDWRTRRGKGNHLSKSIEIDSVGEYEPERDFTVPLIHFKNDEGVEEEARDQDGKPLVWGKFPNQKTTVKNALYGKDSNLLKRDMTSGRVRYFHIPSNNMEVSFKQLQISY
jgi:hypothetical protein